MKFEDALDGKIKITPSTLDEFAILRGAADLINRSIQVNKQTGVNTGPNDDSVNQPHIATRIVLDIASSYHITDLEGYDLLAGINKVAPKMGKFIVEAWEIADQIEAELEARELTHDGYFSIPPDVPNGMV